MNDGEAIAVAILLSLLASEIREIVLVPEQPPRIHAPLAPSIGPHLDYHNPEFKSPSDARIVQISGASISSSLAVANLTAAPPAT